MAAYLIQLTLALRRQETNPQRSVGDAQVEMAGAEMTRLSLLHAESDLPEQALR